MFKKLTLQNWKSFRYAELPIDSLTILIGTNASGKSNVVDAFEFLKRKISGENLNFVLHGHAGVKPVRGGIENIVYRDAPNFLLQLTVTDSSETVELEYSVNVSISPPRSSRPVVRHSENKKIFIIESDGEKNPFPYPEQSISFLKAFSQNEESNPNIDLDSEEFPTVLRGLIDVNHWDKLVKKASAEWEQIFIVSAELKNIGSYSPVSTELNSDGSNLAGFIASLEPDRKTQLEHKLTEYLNHLSELEISKVWVETVGRLNSDAMIYCEEKWGNSGEPVILDARSMSDGTLRFLTIMTAILTRPSGSQLIIEEIDNGLHPSRAKFLIELLRDIGADRKVDVLITTHNSALLDALEPDMMPFVIVAHRDQETGESKLTPLDELEDLPKLLASGTLGNLVTRGAIERSISRHASA